VHGLLWARASSEAAEVEAHLKAASPEYRAAVGQQPGTWYVCPRRGPSSAVKWQSIGWE